MIKRLYIVMIIIFTFVPGFVLSAPKPLFISMSMAIRHLDKAGYHPIYKIEKVDDIYHIKADNAQGQRVELDMDASTGNIIQQYSVHRCRHRHHCRHHHCGGC